MTKYSMTCSCGDAIETEADSLEAAKSKLKGEWTEEVVAAHMRDKHPGQSMTMEQAHAEIDANLKEATA